MVKNNIKISNQLLPKNIPGKLITLKLLSLKYLQNYFNMFSETVQKRINVSTKATLKNTKNFLEKRHKLLQNNKLIFYFVFDNIEKQLIGKIEIRDPKNKKGQLGSWINENYWGNGRYQEALKLITNLYFSITNSKFYTAHIHSKNLRSLYAHKKFGFKTSKKLLVRNQRQYYVLKLNKSGK